MPEMSTTYGEPEKIPTRQPERPRPSQPEQSKETKSANGQQSAKGQAAAGQQGQRTSWDERPRGAGERSGRSERQRELPSHDVYSETIERRTARNSLEFSITSPPAVFGSSS